MKPERLTIAGQGKNPKLSPLRLVNIGEEPAVARKVHWRFRISGFPKHLRVSRAARGLAADGRLLRDPAHVRHRAPIREEHRQMPLVIEERNLASIDIEFP